MDDSSNVSTPQVTQSTLCIERPHHMHAIVVLLQVTVTIWVVQFQQFDNPT